MFIRGLNVYKEEVLNISFNFPPVLQDYDSLVGSLNTGNIFFLP